MSDTQAAEAAKPAVAKKAAKKRKAKPERPANTFRIVDWARKNKIDPRDARRVARAHADELKKLAVDKYTYPNKVEAKVTEIINGALKG